MESLNDKKFSFSEFIGKIGLPTVIIAAFWIFTLIVGVFYGIPLNALISDTIKRAGMNGILVLAMVPSIQSGTGPNFALPIGIVCGLLGIVCTIEFGLTGWAWLLVSILIGVVLAIVIGYLYGKLLNAVKGSEMTIATYTGFSIVAFMCLLWLMLPFENKQIKWMMGAGLRETIQLDAVNGAQIINNFGMFNIGGKLVDGAYAGGVNIPTGLLIVFFIFCLGVWLFFKSKTGIAISSGGINPGFARSAGLNIDRGRIIANVLSTVLAAIGIIVYSQSYGYAQLYLAPLTMAFAAVAAVLIGGATAQRARVSHVIIGVFLFQGLLTTAMPVANEVFKGTDLSEMMRAVIQNGVILYALTQVKGGGK